MSASRLEVVLLMILCCIQYYNNNNIMSRMYEYERSLLHSFLGSFFYLFIYLFICNWVDVRRKEKRKKEEEGKKKKKDGFSIIRVSLFSYFLPFPFLFPPKKSSSWHLLRYIDYPPPPPSHTHTHTVVYRIHPAIHSTVSRNPYVR